MENRKIDNIIAKLKHGIKFGMYNGGSDCYFEDGTKVHYEDLWRAIRTLNNLEMGHKKTLFELYPGTFAGTFPHNFSKYRLTKKFLGMIFGLV